MITNFGEHKYYALFNMSEKRNDNELLNESKSKNNGIIGIKT